MMQGLGFGLAYTGFGVVTGTLVDRVSRTRLMATSMIFWSLASAFCGLAQNFGQMLIGRLSVGIGESTAAPATQSIITGTFPRGRVASAISIYVGVTSLATGLAVALGGMLLDLLTQHPLALLHGLAPWRQVVLVSSLPGVVLAVVLLFTPEPPRRARARIDEGNSWRAYGNFVKQNPAAVLGLLLGNAFGCMASYAALAWAPTYGRRALGMSAQHVGETLGLVIGIGAVVTTLLFGFLVDHRVQKGDYAFAQKLMMSMLALSLPVSMLAFLRDDPTFFLLAIACLQCGVSSCVGPVIASIQMISPRQMSGRTGAVSTIITSVLAYGGGSTIVGVLTDYVYRSPMKLGLSIATTIAIAVPLSFTCFLIAHRAFLRRVALLADGPGGIR
jgi:MFS family permease